jgi:hypothetical protein
MTLTYAVCAREKLAVAYSCTWPHAVSRCRAVSRVARAQTYQSKPITMIMPYAAGGITCVVGQIVAERMRKRLEVRRCLSGAQSPGARRSNNAVAAKNSDQRGQEASSPWL